MSLFLILFLFGAISAKWAMDLEYSELIQILCFVGGVAAGPLVLVILYTRMQYRRNELKREADSNPRPQLIESIDGKV